jgi:uncharacterized protein YjdB
MKYYAAKAATCTTSGTIGYWYCQSCKKKFTDKQGTADAASIKVSATGHTYGAWTTTVKATAAAKGTKQRECTVCGKTQTKSIEKLKAAVTLNRKNMTLYVKQSSDTLKVTKLTEGDAVASWKSSKTSVAAVDKTTGVITAKKAGTAVITVKTACGASASVNVTVIKGTVKTKKLSVTSDYASLENNKVTLTKGTKMKLTAEVSPSYSTESVTYTSSDKKIVTVSAKGVVTAKKAGTAKITVQSGTKKVIIKVTVPKIRTASILEIPANLTISRGKSVSLKPVLSPSDSDDTISYTSSKTSIATVSASGRVKAIKKGTTVITVRSGNVRVKCIVKVM